MPEQSGQNESEKDFLGPFENDKVLCQGSIISGLLYVICNKLEKKLQNNLDTLLLQFVDDLSEIFLNSTKTLSKKIKFIILQ